MLWVDTSTDPYTLKAYNSGGSNWDVFSGFPSGTKMLFQQAAAPTGWTKDTTHNNKALRVVTGTPGSGGSRTFSDVFQNATVTGTVGNTTLTLDQIPTHTHGITDPGHTHTLTDPGHTHGFTNKTSDTTGDVWLKSGASGTAYPCLDGATFTSAPRIKATDVVEVPSGGLDSLDDASTGVTMDTVISNVTVQASGTGDPHTHTFSSGSIDLDVQYVDLIICTRN